MTETTRDRREFVVRFAAAGFVTGVASALAVTLDGLDGLSDWLGAVFGAAFAFVLMAERLADTWRSLAAVAVFQASWWIAVQVGVGLGDSYDELWIVGAFCGLIGAAILVAGFALLYPSCRRVADGLRTLVVGTAAGMLLGYDSPWPLFLVWQTAVAASLGAAIPARRG